MDKVEIRNVEGLYDENLKTLRDMMEELKEMERGRVQKKGSILKGLNFL